MVLQQTKIDWSRQGILYKLEEYEPRIQKLTMKSETHNF